MKWLKRFFRPKMKALIIVKYGVMAHPEKSIPILTQYAKDQGAGIISVHDVDAFRVLSIGPHDRLLVSKRVPRELIMKIANSKPGEIIHAELESFDDIAVVQPQDAAI